MPKPSDADPTPSSAGPSPSQESAVASGLSPEFGARLVDEIHLLDYAKTLYKRRWTAAATFLVVFLSVTIYTFTAIPIYEASVKLLIESDAPNFISFQQVIEDGQAQADYYQTQYNILESRALARKTLEAQQLWEHPDFGDDDSFSVGRAISGAATAVSTSVAQLVGATDGRVPGSPEDDQSVAQSEVIDRFLDRLRVSPVRNSRIVQVSFRSAQPRLATTVVDTLARAYIDQNLEFKFAQSVEASEWLGERLGEQRQHVEESEAALQRYREENDAVSLDERQDIVVQKLADLNAALTLSRTDRIEKEARYEQLLVVQNDRDALETFPAILSNVFIQQQKGELATLQRTQAQLAENLGDRHPQIIEIRSAIENTEALIDREIADVVQSVRTEFLTMQAQEQSLGEALDAQKDEALLLNRKGIDYGVLRREAESHRQIYESLLQRANETGVSGELRTSNIRVVDAAELPDRPVSPRKTLNLFLALFGGVTMAFGLSFFFEYLDNRIKTPEDIKTYLGLPFLGMIPQVSKKASGGAELLLNTGTPAIFAEALKTVRTNLLFSSSAEGAQAIAVTSTGPGEGKSVVATNVGIGLAQASQRVLVIDADMRNPTVHVRFGQKSEPGLSNFTVGDAKASEVVHKTTVPRLWILPAGKIPPNPAELLASKRFEHFLSSLDEHFDWVIIDTPPVLPVADATIVAQAVTGVLFVIGAEMTDRRAADAAVNQLTQVNARIVGGVLNRVDLLRNSYYYSQYYRREYAKYYHQTETS